MYSKHFSVRIIALISCRFSLDTLKMADKQKLIEVTYLDHCNGVPEFNQVSQSDGRSYNCTHILTHGGLSLLGHLRQLKFFHHMPSTCTLELRSAVLVYCWAATY